MSCRAYLLCRTSSRAATRKSLAEGRMAEAAETVLKPAGVAASLGARELVLKPVAVAVLGAQGSVLKPAGVAWAAQPALEQASKADRPPLVFRTAAQKSRRSGSSTAFPPEYSACRSDKEPARPVHPPAPEPRAYHAVAPAKRGAQPGAEGFPVVQASRARLD